MVGLLAPVGHRSEETVPQQMRVALLDPLEIALRHPRDPRGPPYGDGLETSRQPGAPPVPGEGLLGAGEDLHPGVDVIDPVGDARGGVQQPAQQCPVERRDGDVQQVDALLSDNPTRRVVEEDEAAEADVADQAGTGDRKGAACMDTLPSGQKTAKVHVETLLVIPLVDRQDLRLPSEGWQMPGEEARPVDGSQVRGRIVRADDEDSPHGKEGSGHRLTRDRSHLSVPPPRQDGRTAYGGQSRRPPGLPGR